ncbi:MAG: glutathione synthase [Pelagibacteraceae bacterium TMED201]|nr:MAG: glutathione synthase [Pelagibacteraceae bacterium TMED201]|tara:strand:- start:2452 stop:3381 length:930 start_codon:yes stop_codon:yes gene_type:complete
MNKIVAIQADPIEKINPKTDTTLLLALEAQKRKHKIYWFESKDLSFINSKLFADVKELKLFSNDKKYFKIIRKKKFDLSSSKVILIRQDPPFNIDYINSTLLLDIIKNKTEIINNPESVRNISEKLFSIKFMQLMPPTIFTKNLKEIINFYQKHKKILLKPVNGYAGKNIYFINKKINQRELMNYLRKTGFVMVQKFLPLIKYGDKRIFIINGKVVGAIRRVPSKNSILSNISQGGKAFKTNLNKFEKKVSNHVAKILKKNNIYFAGIDLISGKLIGDINVTSPTGLTQFKKLTGINLAEYFWDKLKLK